MRRMRQKILNYLPRQADLLKRVSETKVTSRVVTIPPLRVPPKRNYQQGATTMNQTIRNQLPYRFESLPQPGKIKIVNVREQILIVTRDEIERQLEREDLDVHRRRMYEAALIELNKGQPS
jgi:hypothetical protein